MRTHIYTQDDLIYINIVPLIDNTEKETNKQVNANDKCTLNRTQQ